MSMVTWWARTGRRSWCDFLTESKGKIFWEHSNFTDFVCRFDDISCRLVNGFPSTRDSNRYWLNCCWNCSWWIVSHAGGRGVNTAPAVLLGRFCSRLSFTCKWTSLAYSLRFFRSWRAAITSAACLFSSHSVIFLSKMRDNCSPLRYLSPSSSLQFSHSNLHLINLWWVKSFRMTRICSNKNNQSTLSIHRKAICIFNPQKDIHLQILAKLNSSQKK